MRLPLSLRIRHADPIALAACALALLVHAAAVAAPTRFSAAAVDAFATRYGSGARGRLLEWQALMERFYSRSASEKRVATNDFWNRIPWVSDQENWGKRDYWATPMEVLGTNGADCEDYSIAKYFTLADMRVPAEKLLITYVRAPRLKQTHMVLAYYETPDSDPLILDNLDGRILRGSQRTDLIPVYSFNVEGLWRAVERGRGRRVGSSSRLDPWRDLLGRMEREPR